MSNFEDLSPLSPYSCPSSFPPFHFLFAKYNIFASDVDSASEKVYSNLKKFLGSLPSNSPVRTAFLQVLGDGLSAREFAQLLALKEDSVRKAFNKEKIEFVDLFRALV
jgi:hypothetical protein